MANTGDVLHNLDAFNHDGLVLQYGYIMEKSKSSIKYEYSGGYMIEGSPVQRRMSIEYVEETKIRRPATPFGFGLKSANFTGTQQAIIAALGINRVPKRR
jgi:hypothetical protein